MLQQYISKPYPEEHQLCNRFFWFSFYKYHTHIPHECNIYDLTLPNFFPPVIMQLAYIHPMNRSSLISLKESFFSIRWSFNLYLFKDPSISLFVRQTTCVTRSCSEYYQNKHDMHVSVISRTWCFILCSVFICHYKSLSLCEDIPKNKSLQLAELKNISIHHTAILLSIHFK